MTWLIKGEEDDPFEDEYLSEHGDGCACWSEHQRDAKRFSDQGHAYRVARKWSGRVVRLVPRTPHPRKEEKRGT